uniref:Uncharacterized protein n=1 Tax=Caenorhabditis japonica TaxID=281687 RepID=A0A8R1EVE8_CAEJA
MGTIFNHVFGSTKLNRPQEELNQGVQIAVCNSLATTPSDTDCKRYELIFSVRSAANALPSHSDGRGRVCDERVQKIKRAVADVLL